jgi:hypothetical protein
MFYSKPGVLGGNPLIVIYAIHTYFTIIILLMELPLRNNLRLQ